MVRRSLLAMVAALTAAALAVGFAAAPAAAAPPTGPAAASLARQDAEIQVRRGTSIPTSVHARSPVAWGCFWNDWDRWLCAPQIVGWRLYTNQ